MKTAKIVKLQINEWDWQYGKMYSHIMELDNGENIKLNKKKDNSFKVWDTVNYEENGEWKWKEVKEEKTFQPRAYNPEANNRWAMIGMAIKMAFDKVYQWEDDFQKAAYLSQRIFELAMDMYNGNESDSNKLNETAENDDLPF
jgi:hypothetical protein